MRLPTPPGDAPQPLEAAAETRRCAAARLLRHTAAGAGSARRQRAPATRAVGTPAMRAAAGMQRGLAAAWERRRRV
jgi:hypothetical protein